MALIMAAVAEEGLIGTEPPVDVDARAQRFRASIEAEGPGASWVLDDAGRVVGHAGVREQAPGVLYTSEWPSSARRADRAAGERSCKRSWTTPKRTVRTSSSLRSGLTTRVRSRSTLLPASRSKGYGVITTAVWTEASEARS